MFEVTEHKDEHFYYCEIRDTIINITVSAAGRNRQRARAFALDELSQYLLKQFPLTTF